MYYKTSKSVNHSFKLKRKKNRLQQLTFYQNILHAVLFSCPFRIIGENCDSKCIQNRAANVCIYHLKMTLKATNTEKSEIYIFENKC